MLRRAELSEKSWREYIISKTTETWIVRNQVELEDHDDDDIHSIITDLITDPEVIRDAKEELESWSTQELVGFLVELMAAALQVGNDFYKIFLPLKYKIRATAKRE